MHQASVGFHCPECTRSGKQKVVSARSLVTRPVVAFALIAANVAVFVADLMSPIVNVQSVADLAFRGMHQITADGALYGPAVAEGEWWRVITGGFLHANLLHIGFNMFLLYQLGMLLEPAVKRWGFGVLYLMSLLGGSFLTLVLDNDAVTIGASGAVFGLMGATFVAMRSRGINPFQTGIGPLILINLVFTFAVPGISIGGHIGGLITGAVGAWILWEWAPRLGPKSPLPADRVRCHRRRPVRRLPAGRAASGPADGARAYPRPDASVTRGGEAPQVPPPDQLQHRPAHESAQRPTEPPGEPQRLVPGQPGAAPPAPAEHEPTRAGHEPAVPHAHRAPLPPLGDLHEVERAQGPDPRLALERRADARPLVAGEADRRGVGHPRHVVGDVGQSPPDGVRRGVDGGLDADAGHALRMAAGRAAGGPARQPPCRTPRS